MLNAHQYTRTPNGSVQPHAPAGASSSCDGPRPAEADLHVPGDPETSPFQTRQPPQHPGDKAATAAKQETRQPPSSSSEPCPPRRTRHDTHCSSPERPTTDSPSGRQKPTTTKPTPKGRKPRTGNRNPEPPGEDTTTAGPYTTDGDKAVTAAKDARKQRVADNPYTRTQQDARQQQQARGQPATEARGDTRGQRTSATGATARDDQLRPPPAAERDRRSRTTGPSPPPRTQNDQPEIPLNTAVANTTVQAKRDLPPTCGVMVAGGIEHLDTHWARGELDGHQPPRHPPATLPPEGSPAPGVVMSRAIPSGGWQDWPTHTGRNNEPTVLQWRLQQQPQASGSSSSSSSTGAPLPPHSRPVLAPNTRLAFLLLGPWASYQRLNRASAAIPTHWLVLIQSAPPQGCSAPSPGTHHLPFHTGHSFILRQVGDLDRLGGASDLSTALTRATNQDISTNATAQPARQAQGAHRPPQATTDTDTAAAATTTDRAQDHQQPAATTNPGRGAQPTQQAQGGNRQPRTTQLPQQTHPQQMLQPQTDRAHRPPPPDATTMPRQRRGRTPSRDPNAPHHTQDKAGDQSTPHTTAARRSNSPPQTHGKSPTGKQAARNSGETATTTSPTEPARHRPQSGEQCSRDRPDTTTTDRATPGTSSRTPAGQLMGQNAPPRY